MKRRVFAAVLLLLLLCGCGGAAEDEALPALVIGVDDFAPFNYIDADGAVVGFDAELAEEACRRLGYAPEFRLIPWSEKTGLLERGEIDCIWSCYTLTGREDLAAALTETLRAMEAEGFIAALAEKYDLAPAEE